MDSSFYSFSGEPPPPLQQQLQQQQQQPLSSTPPRRQVQLQGPRPSALQIHEESRKIKKPPRPPPRQNPIIIYAVSPKIIHTEESNFMSVVQRLTGLSSGDFSNDGTVSPAARLASTEKASPRDRGTTSSVAASGGDESSVDIMDTIDGLDFGQFPGILSPAPTMLPPVPSGFFSPVTDHFFSEMSPFLNGSSSFVASPSGLLTASIASPLTSPDIFNLLNMDF